MLISKIVLLAIFTPSILGAALSLGPDHLIARDALPSSLEARAVAPFTTILNANQSVYLEQPLNETTWQLIDSDGDDVPDLHFIKTGNTASGKVVVRVASGASKFATNILTAITTFDTQNDGTWLMVPSATNTPPDLAFIQTANTPSGNVEVFLASGSSQYQDLTSHVVTTFEEATDGTWTLFDFSGEGLLDLVFIQTSGVSNGTVEVFVASGLSNFQAITFQSVTVLPEGETGFWSLTPFLSNDGDLTFIQDAGTTSGKVEIHIASRASNYKTVALSATSTAFTEQADGVWQLIDMNRDGILDLAFIKTSNTVAGTTNVFAASGA